MPVRFGGLTADEHITEQIVRESGRTTMSDPIPVPTGTPVQLMAQFTDYALWCEQFLEEMAALARKQYRLIQKIKDPRLQESPGIGEARYRSKAMTADLHDLASRICLLEAKCDRYWRALPVDVRGGYGLDFNVPPEKKRLIGQAWRGMAGQFRWPTNYTFQVGMVRAIPYALQHDLHRCGVDGLPLGPIVDPFTEEQ